MAKSGDDKGSPAQEQRDDIVVAFGLVLARYRRERGVSQEQLGWTASVDRKFISRIENGQREPGLGTIVKLVRALDVPLGAFMAAVENEVAARNNQV